MSDDSSAQPPCAGRTRQGLVNEVSNSSTRVSLTLKETYFALSSNYGFRHYFLLYVLKFILLPAVCLCSLGSFLINLQHHWREMMLPVRFFHHKKGNETSMRVPLPKSTNFCTLESMLLDPCNKTPLFLPIEFLRAITHDFSKERELGRGGYGVVYKGILQNGKTVAVKKLYEIHIEDAQFQKEVTYLIGLKHKNIVQLVGYCAESRWEATEVRGNYVLAEIRNRLLCFEYLNHKSLDKHLSAESCGLEWHMIFEIIRGISCGLHYLHAECHIVHLDLKPQNILLDDDMLPKIADFGMSRLFSEHQSRIITKSREGTLGYMAPEYITKGEISTKADIFSLGVIIIQLMTGCRRYPSSTSSEASFGHFLENVIGNWRNRLEKISLELYSQQVNTCIVIGLKCVDHDPDQRPTARDILEMLNALESTKMYPGMSSQPPLSPQPVIQHQEDSRCQELSMPILESQIGILPRSSTGNSSNSGIDSNGVLERASSTSRIDANTSWFTFSANRSQIGILSFEVANTIFKGSDLMETLSKQSMKHLKEVVFSSKGVRSLISEDHNQLLALVEADIREDLRQFSMEVARFGNRCKDPEWHCLDRYFLRLQSELKPGENSSETVVSNIQYLIKLAQRTSELYQEMFALDKLYMTSEDPSVTHAICISAIKRDTLKNLKRKSLWSKKMEEIIDKLVDFVYFLHLEINTAFLKNHGHQTTEKASNIDQMLGPNGLALHYANVILHINTLAFPSSVEVNKKVRDALYQALPSFIKSRLRQSSSTVKTVEEARAEMNQILQWLVPAAESTRSYYMNGAYGEWEFKGMEDIDFDEAENHQRTVSAMLRHGNAKVNRIETLYYADKETTEGYILDLLWALQVYIEEISVVYDEYTDSSKESPRSCTNELELLHVDWISTVQAQAECIQENIASLKGA